MIHGSYNSEVGNYNYVNNYAIERKQEDPLQKLYKAHLERSMRDPDIKILPKKEIEIIKKRIHALYYAKDR